MVGVNNARRRFSPLYKALILHLRRARWLASRGDAGGGMDWLPGGLREKVEFEAIGALNKNGDLEKNPLWQGFPSGLLKQHVPEDLEFRAQVC